MNSTNRYCWLWLVALLSAAAGLTAARAAVSAHSGRLGPATGGLAITWNPTRKQLEEMGLLRRHELEDGNTPPKAIPKPPYPPPNFTPGRHGFDFLWGSPDWNKN